MHTCPSCAAPLDADGICTSCGALSRGFFRDLELGPPQIAAAVARGLDFYRLLEVPPDVDTHTIARRYRRLRVIFPDDPRSLAPEPARRLELLEVAGRVLTDPALRQRYDQLRTQNAQPTLGVLRCEACAAPLDCSRPTCPYCGTARPQPAQPPQVSPTTGPLPAEPVDYYALIGLTAEHLGIGQQQPQRMSGERYRGYTTQASRFGRPPTPEEVDAAAYERQRAALVGAGGDATERERRFQELEIARRILRDERRRPQYDALLQSFGKGLFDRGRIEALHQLQESVAAEIRVEQSQPSTMQQDEALIQQAQGYIAAGMPRDALPLLRKLVSADTADPRAHRLFAQAALASDDPLSLGGHVLRQIVRSLEASATQGEEAPEATALSALCRGLLAREDGHDTQAEVHLYAAVGQNPQLGPGWRALAALAMARGEYDRSITHARRAVTADPHDERALLLIAAACIQSRRRDQARDVAAQIARIRGGEWHIDAILHEVGG